MQSELIGALLETMDSKIFSLVLQLIVVGAIFMWLKDFNGRVVNYFKLRMSEFGRGTKVRIEGIEGYVRHIGFNEVEIVINENETLLMPVSRFMSISKVIIVQGPVKP